MFNKILIANRGEIACRVITTARRLGIRTVAVYSDADAHTRHVRMADEAWPIGPAASRESYLRMEKILTVAKQSGAEAIHPGYGFLSENEEFATLCAEQGIVFIGPSAAAIHAMGSKSEAKALMEKANVPLIPGYHGTDQSYDCLLERAREIGFPVLLKASAGGGGKGMRAVHHEQEFSDALSSAQREALSAFGDARMLIEKLLINPRHIEVQILGDQQGNTVYLFDRDCSLQRRHQKVVEEAPAPDVAENTRRAMGNAAVRAAQSIGYHGAGTIEFLLDERGDFYFMEMNTRLQVEHPVTEMVTGLDLVELQLLVATRQTLPFKQENLTCKGHAVEVRLYAEDPEQDFMPATGEVQSFTWPATEGLRVDSGVESGDAVSMHYDPMIAKMIGWGVDRRTAIAKLDQALRGLRLSGLRHNAGFLHRLISQPDFLNGAVNTHFIADHREALGLSVNDAGLPLPAIAAITHHLHEVQRQKTSSPDSPWAQLDDFRLMGNACHEKYLRMNQDDFTVSFRRQSPLQWAWQIGELSGVIGISLTSADVRVDTSERSLSLGFEIEGDRVRLFFNGDTLEFLSTTPDFNPDHQSGKEQHYRAPMNGRIIAVNALPGSLVRQGDTLLIMEAMKMEHRIRAHADGIIKDIQVGVGDLVNEGQTLVDLEKEAAT